MYVYEDNIMGVAGVVRRNLIVVEDVDTGEKKRIYCPKWNKRQVQRYCRAVVHSMAKTKEENDND